MATSRGIPGVEAAGVLAAIAGASAISRFAFAVLADRYGGRLTLSISLLGQSLPVILLFFGGKVAVKVTLSRGIGHGLHKGAHDKDYTYQKYTSNENKQMLGSPLPPVTLHLILTNRGQDSVTVSMIDFDSEMGNFAIDPETLTLGPGQTGEPTPMVSDLGVSSDSISFKVTLKYGATRETRSFPVVIVAPAPERGEQSESVLREFGFDAAALEELRASNVI